MQKSSTVVCNRDPRAAESGDNEENPEGAPRHRDGVVSVTREKPERQSENTEGKEKEMRFFFGGRRKIYAAPCALYTREEGTDNSEPFLPPPGFWMRSG